MKDIIIWVAGYQGEQAYWNLREQYNVVFFVDKNIDKQKDFFMGHKVYAPEKIKEFPDIEVAVSVLNHFNEIAMQLEEWGHKAFIPCGSTECIRDGIQSIVLNNRCIDLAAFLENASNECLALPELTFQYGGSGVLDYAFLKALAIKTKAKTYFEIGTYIGESINIMADICEKCYSLTANPESPYSMKNFCKDMHLTDYSDRLTYKTNIEHFYGNSRLFDFARVTEKIDIYFIDGDHSYNGVYCDTVNVFNSKDERSIVVWHDFLRNPNSNVPIAIYDALNKEDFSKVYCTDNNMCAVYLPDKYKSVIKLIDKNNEEAVNDLNTYSIDIRIGKITVR